MIPGWVAAIPEIYWALAFGFVLVVVLGFRDAIRRWADRKEEAIAARRAEDARLRQDPHAHFHLTVAEIEARTPPPERVAWGGPERWRFGAETFASFEDAGEARRVAILRQARGFYQDIDRLQLGRN
jgi:hypothetical protein